MPKGVKNNVVPFRDGTKVIIEAGKVALLLYIIGKYTNWYTELDKKEFTLIDEVTTILEKKRDEYTNS